MDIVDFLVAFGFFYPALSDLDRLPHGEASTQIERCTKHIKRIEMMQSVRGWECGKWEDALAETRSRLDYWHLLERARVAYYSGEQQLCRRRLQFLKEHIGPSLYYKKWAPALIPTWPGEEPMQRGDS